jgi:hypothetical protein
MSKADDLRAELAQAEAEEAFEVAKADYAAGGSAKPYQKALKAAVKARLRYRIAQGRPGSENYTVKGDKVFAVVATTKLKKTRNAEGVITDTEKYVETQEVEV